MKIKDIYPELRSGRTSKFVKSKTASFGINKPLKIIVHHSGGSDSNPLSDSSNFTFAQCEILHKARFNMKSSLGFWTGYQYVIEKSGKLYQARKDTEEGAHTISHNKTSIGIMLSGNFDATVPTASQIATLKALLVTKMTEHKISSDNIFPHRKFAVKTCYGNKLGDNWSRDLVKVDLKAKAQELLTQANSLVDQAAAIINQLN